MLIFGPLVRPRTSADTATLASAAASDVTVSPSTTRTAGSDTVSPTLSVRLSISMTSPTATFCWVPPLRTIAYTVDLTLCWIGKLYGGLHRPGGPHKHGTRNARRRSSLRVPSQTGQTGLPACSGTHITLLSRRLARAPGPRSAPRLRQYSRHPR